MVIEVREEPDIQRTSSPGATSILEATVNGANGAVGRAAKRSPTMNVWKELAVNQSFTAGRPTPAGSVTPPRQLPRARPDRLPLLPPDLHRDGHPASTASSVSVGGQTPQRRAAHGDEKRPTGVCCLFSRRHAQVGAGEVPSAGPVAGGGGRCPDAGARVEWRGCEWPPRLWSPGPRRRHPSGSSCPRAACSVVPD